MPDPTPRRERAQTTTSGIPSHRPDQGRVRTQLPTTATTPTPTPTSPEPDGEGGGEGEGDPELTDDEFPVFYTPVGDDKHLTAPDHNPDPPNWEGWKLLGYSTDPPGALFIAPINSPLPTLDELLKPHTVRITLGGMVAPGSQIDTTPPDQD